MGSEMHYQEKFVELLKKTLPSNINPAEELADILSVSTDSIYRRLRCQSSFTFDEAVRISKAFGISLDSMIHDQNQKVTFSYTPMYEDSLNFKSYFEGFQDFLKKASLSERSRIVYAAEDIPVFRHFNHPFLSSFKSFYWKKSVLNSPDIQGAKYDPNIVSEELRILNQNTFKIYEQLNRVEIWTNETIDSTLNQVDFFWESGFFEKKDDALQVMDEIQDLINLLSAECESTGEAVLGKPHESLLYFCEVVIGNNSVLIESGKDDDSGTVYLGYNTFNSIATDNPAFIKETRSWIENLIKKSILLTNSGEKQRLKFFRKMAAKIDALKAKIREN
ncbi:MAG: hypothetical protein H6605_10760 [Flavobacteriales bacterium]|nr:hypothetical protein [Flavobacteriales bacterium]